MDSWIVRLSLVLDIAPDTLRGLLETLGVLLVVGLARWVALRVAHRKLSDDVQRHYFVRRSIHYVSTVLGLLLVGRIWFAGLQNLGTFLGLLSAGIAIALGDLLANFAGAIFLLLRRPYEVGDRVEIDGQIGDVIDIRLFTTYLMECGNWVDADQSTGRMLIVPHNYVFKKPIANYTRGFAYIWDEIPVLVTFESDWRRARALLRAIVVEHGQPLSEGAQEEIRRAAGTHMIVF